MTLDAIGLSAALGSALAWAIGLIFLKLVKADVPALSMTLVTGVLGSACMGGMLWITGFEPVAWQPFVVLGVSGLLGIALGDTFFFESLGGLSVHLVVAFAILGHAVTILLAVLFLGERLTGVQVLGIALVLVGVTVTLYESTEQRATRRGVLFGLLSTAAISVSIILAKLGLETTSAGQATFVRMVWAAAGVLLLGLSTGRLGSWLAPFRDRRLLRYVVLAVLIGTFGGFLLYHVALKHIDVAVANPLSATEPLFTLPLAAIFLHEKVRPRSVVGLLVGVSGVLLLSLL